MSIVRKGDPLFTASNEEGKCLWCNKPAEYDHEVFCFERCGYLFGVTMSSMGHRVYVSLGGTPLNDGDPPLKTMKLRRIGRPGLGICDWGACIDPAVAERHNEEHGWLPVCETHMEKD